MMTMGSESEDLPIELETEAGALISELRETGWTVSAFRYDAKSFGDWYVDLRCEDRMVRLVKDRSQYMIDGPTEEIKAAGLWKAFNDFGEFRRAINNWVTKPYVPFVDIDPSNPN
jgi:hypothetical protein